MLKIKRRSNIFFYGMPLCGLFFIDLYATRSSLHSRLTERFFLSPFNKVFSAAPLYRLRRFAHGFVFAQQNFFIGWGRLTACIAGHAIQRKNPQDESQRFSNAIQRKNPQDESQRFSKWRVTSRYLCIRPCG